MRPRVAGSINCHIFPEQLPLWVSQEDLSYLGIEDDINGICG